MQMGLYRLTDGGNGDATDVDQVVDALSGNNDIGQISLFAPIAVPGALTAAVKATAGNLTGTYKYAVCFLTGYWQGATGVGTIHTQGNTGIGTASASITPSAQQGALSVIPIGPTGTVARILCRTKANGSTYYVLTQINDNVTTAWTDNVADAALTVLASSSNTTGTLLELPNLAAYPPVGPLNTICIVSGQLYQSNGAAWLALAPALAPATATSLGGVKAGAGVDVQIDGTISVNPLSQMAYWL